MATVTNQTVEGVEEKTIENHRVFLEEHIDPDTGLLDKLLANGTLSNREVRQIKIFKSFDKRNAELLNFILTKHNCDSLVKALRETDQTHIVNYLNYNGEYQPDIGKEWPLTANEVLTLNTNQEVLVDLLECDELIGCLYSKTVINKRQKISISSEPNSIKKNEALLEILHRRSLRDYFQTIECFCETNQKHIAKILEDGGVVVRVHANLDGENVTETEDELSTAIANILIDSSISQPNRIFELAQLKVIAAKTGQSIILYIYCRTFEELQQLQKSLTSGQLKHSVELLFNGLLTRSQKIRAAALTASEEEFQKLRTYFRDQEIGEKTRRERYFDDTETNVQHEELKASAKVPTVSETKEITSETGDVMATGGLKTARDEMKQLLAFQELFKGRFNTEEVAILLEKFEWNSKEAASFVMAAETTDVRKLIDDERTSWVTVAKTSKKTEENLAKNIQDLKKSPSLLRDVRLGRIDTTTRLFACAPCDRIWWRKTPERKQVSKCYLCKIRFDPVPRDMEWGWAMFKCPKCLHEFSGFCGMWQTSPCYRCHEQVLPYCVQPPTTGHTKRSTNTHRCNTPDCQHNLLKAGNPAGGPCNVRALPREQMAKVGDDDYEPLPQSCVHPSTRRAQNQPNVIVASRPHDSTGSTVDTFLTQADFDEKHEVIIPMATIHESDEDQ